MLLRAYENSLKGSNLQEILFDYSVPITPKYHKKMKYRIYESITRLIRFSKSKTLKRSWFYIFKPVCVGFLPDFVIRIIKDRF